MSWLWDLDRAAQQWTQGAAVQQDAMLRALGEAFAWWGGPGVIWFTGLLWLGARALRRPRVSLVGLRGLEALLVASAVSGVTKGFAGRSRPFLVPGEPWHWDFAHGWTDARYFSMPSGHTTATFAFSVAVTVIAAGWRPAARAAWTAAVLLCATGVGFARLLGNQHWLSDVVVGALLGGAIGWVVARWHLGRPGTAFDRVLAGTAS